MKKIAITLSLILISFFNATAQNEVQTNGNTTSTELVTAIPKTDWLKDFIGIKIDGPILVTLERAESPEDVRIVYDTKGCITSKFKAEINRNGILCVEEKYDPKRTSVTEVKIYYTRLRNVKISHAKCSFNSTIDEKIFDLGVAGGIGESQGSIIFQNDVKEAGSLALGNIGMVLQGGNFIKFQLKNTAVIGFDIAAGSFRLGKDRCQTVSRQMEYRLSGCTGGSIIRLVRRGAAGDSDGEEQEHHHRQKSLAECCERCFHITISSRFFLISL